MKAPFALPFVAATGALAQNFNSGSFTGTATLTISGSTVTVGGTNVATFTVGSSTITVGGTSSTSSDDATATTSSDSDDGTSSSESDEDAGDNNSSSSAAASSASSSGSGNNNFDSLTSGYTGSPITVEFGSSTITLGSYASGGFSNSANATATTGSSTAGVSGGGSDAGSTDGSGSATATPSGPTTSLAIATTPPNSGANTVQAATGVLALIGLALAFIM
ncbi:hypothetical protein EKO27_g399 [Xylaria grammica]|uniref:Uncharacterized protein n=1 Tax=Xylaria grammica TaxID=363999 RepID=A0A439DJX6_9PEZI|nr:hypothetical protein EKO27_g399 [Xylaria grammica]